MAREARFIEAQLAREAAAVPFAFGAVIPVLGSDRVIVEGGPRGGRLLCDRIEVRDPAQAPRLIRAAVLEAVREETCGYWDRLRVPHAQVSVREMRSRWGSCGSDGRTVFQWRLGFAPYDVLRYVAAHEAAHRRVMDHSPRFWAEVEALMPDHEPHRQWLRKHGESLFRYGRRD
jgi:predicted metal-dependent hydrolase